MPDMTRLLDRLEEAGLVERARENDDRRMVRSLREPLRHRRDQRLVLFMADSRKREVMEAAAARPEFYLHDQGL